MSFETVILHGIDESYPKSISVEEVAEFIFATKQAVYKWEKGLNYPQADKMISLAMLYGVNPIAFFMEEGDEPSFLCMLTSVYGLSSNFSTASIALSMAFPKMAYKSTVLIKSI